MNKAKSELLVDGFVREQERQLSLSNIIPESIYTIIFQFQLLLEIWNRKLSDSRAELSDDCSIAAIAGKIDVSSCVTLYGDHIVKYGDSFEWKLTLLEEKKCSANFVLGLIPNNDELLEKYKTEFSWYRELRHGGCFALGGMTGHFGHRGMSHQYSTDNVFGKEGDVLKINFNWKESILSFEANGRDFGNALTQKSIKVTQEANAEYRFIASIIWANDVKLMIEGYCA